MRSRRTIRSAAAVLAALALPFSALAHEPPVDPATPVDTAPPVGATPPTDPVDATPPWMPPTEDPAAQAPPPARSTATDPTVHGEDDRVVRINEYPPNSVVGEYGVDFDALDTDGDGHIGRDEARADPTLSAEFDAVDSNRDGRLSREELSGWSR